MSYMTYIKVYMRHICFLHETYVIKICFICDSLKFMYDTYT